MKRLTWFMWYTAMFHKIEIKLTFFDLRNLTPYTHWNQSIQRMRVLYCRKFCYYFQKQWMETLWIFSHSILSAQMFWFIVSTGISENLGFSQTWSLFYCKSLLINVSKCSHADLYRSLNWQLKIKVDTVCCFNVSVLRNEQLFNQGGWKKLYPLYLEHTFWSGFL